MAKKKPIVSPLGQWAYPGEVTIIPSSNITMKGVNYPVLGVDDLGNSQMMMPGKDYNFPGNYVTEIPQMGKGGLRQWFAEEWTDVKTGKPCGRSGDEKGSRPYPACRPKKRVNETTPKTTSEMSSAEKAKFKREKTSGKRIDYNHKRRQDGGEEDSTIENITEFFDPTGIMSWDDASKAYNQWKKSNSTLPSMNQALDMFGAVPGLGKLSKIKYLDPDAIKTAYKYIPWQQIVNAFDTVEDEASKVKKPIKKEYGGWLEEYQRGGTLPPIYTSNPNDPRIRSYRDSLNLYNEYSTPSSVIRQLQEIKKDSSLKYYRPSTRTELNNFPGKIKPIIGTEFDNSRLYADLIAGRDTSHSYFPVYDKKGKIIPNKIKTSIAFKKPVQPYIYKKPEDVPEVVETPVVPVPVVEPSKPSLFVSNIDRDMYTPGGGMAREYNIGVTLQDGNRKSFRTEKEFQDWKAANNLDISKAKVTEGRGYSYDYPENKKYGGWLEQYQSGGSFTNLLKLALTPEVRGHVAKTLVDKGTTKVAEKVGDVSKQQIFDRYRPIDYPDVIGAVVNSGKDVPLRDWQGDYHVSEEAWRLALGLPTKPKYISPSKYKPSKANDPNAQYYALNNVYDPQKLIDAYIQKSQGKPGQTIQMDALSPYIINQDMMTTDNEIPFTQTDPLQKFILSQGEDERGRYVSIYDKYDFNLPYMDAVVYGSNRKPYEFYDRFYYKKDATGKPIYVKQKKQGGQIDWLKKYK